MVSRPWRDNCVKSSLHLHRLETSGFGESGCDAIYVAARRTVEAETDIALYVFGVSGPGYSADIWDGVRRNKWIAEHDVPTKSSLGE